jgi:hypothetical protein
MHYMLLIYDDEQAWARMPEAERSAIVEEYFAVTHELRNRGVYVGGAPLQPTSAATSVRVRDGEQLVTDGPFAETKEQLGGYFLLETESLDEALECAALLPAARYGTIEVRPVIPTRSGTPACARSRTSSASSRGACSRP